MYAYNVERPDFFPNLRKEASEPFRGQTAIVDEKPYLVIDKIGNDFILEGEDGYYLSLETFDFAPANENNSLVAASRVNAPFVENSEIGDWTIGKIAFVEGNWYIRNGNSDEIVPLNDLVDMLEEGAWFKQPFLENFTVYYTPSERLAKQASLKKTAEVIETYLPRAGWHNGCVGLANQLGLEGTITYPDGESLDVKDPKNFMKPLMMRIPVAEFNNTPITVETDNPQLFWEIWEDQKRRGGAGGENRIRTGNVVYTLPDTPGQHFLDSMDVVAARSDYEHWNEDADLMWWEEEGKHQDDPNDFDRDDDYDLGMEADAMDEGYEEAISGVPPDVLDIPYSDPDAIKAFLSGYNEGRKDRGWDPLTPEEFKRYVYDASPQPRTNYPDYLGGWQKGSPYPGHHDEEKSNDKEHIKGAPAKVNEIYHAIRRDNPDVSEEQAAKMAWSQYKKKSAAGDISPVDTIAGGVPQDIPFQDTSQDVVHAYEDGDVVLMNGTTTFDPNRAYLFLVGQKEFDKAKLVKELIDRSPPAELPSAVIPPDEAQQPQMKLPEEAPLDPTGGQPESQSGAPVQPGAEVPPMPVRPRASVKKAEENGAINDTLKNDPEYQQGFADGYDKKMPVNNQEVYEIGYADGLAWKRAEEQWDAEMDKMEPITPRWGYPDRYELSSVEFYASKEARKDFSHSEQKDLINENLEGRARNYDKLDLEGTHYELEQESSFEDFLWQ